MKIDVLCNDGSPLSVSEESIYGVGRHSGVGGAELALLTLCRGWHDAGHDVTLYNDPANANGSCFRQARIENFRPHDSRDILIIFRSPNDKILHAKGKKIWFSCDQHTVGDFKELSQRVDKIVCISTYHAEYFKTMYGIFNTTVIDLPVRTWEYETEPHKIKNSCIFTSVPDRGLMQLLPIWNRIMAEVPDASLTITSDWSLWTGHDMGHAVSPYRMTWAGARNVVYRGAVSRKELIQIQQSADFHLYPHISPYPELFCISVAESQVAGVTPITSRIGALNTTNRYGYLIDGNPDDRSFAKEFADKVIELMKSESRRDIIPRARIEFGMDRIMKEWERVFND